MDNEKHSKTTVELDAIIADLEARISALPKGSITHKRVNGHVYPYHRWSEGGKRRERFLPADEAEDLAAKISERKELETRLKLAKTSQAANPAATAAAAAGDREPHFSMNILVGEDLTAFCRPVSKLRRRDCFSALHDYLHGDAQDKVFVLYGLRRTGKTTLIRQAISAMDGEMRAHAAFVQVSPGNTLADANHDLRLLARQDIRCVFFDEATLMDDFVEGAALFSDIFAASGMHIVLSGTDSLGFAFAADEQLYDRCIMQHTTFIPYREFERVLDIGGIDAYIRYGGTMSLSGARYAEASTFATRRSAEEYVDSAIARNIQHSLARYQDGGHFRALRNLYERGELTSAINRVVEDANHRFTLEVLTRDFRSGDLARSARNLRSDRDRPTDVLDRIDLATVTKRLRALLEIRNEEERTAALGEAHVGEIREYLELLDLVEPIDVASLPSGEAKAGRYAITQPGLRYAQADALVESLLEDAAMADLSFEDRRYVLGRVRSEIMGRMLEDIVLLETKLARPRMRVFALQFAIGEYDMVVFDPDAGGCEIYEVKHSDKRAAEQRRHLLDAEKRRMTEHRFGPIAKTTVLYRGEDAEEGGVRYLNVEGYLRKLG